MRLADRPKIRFNPNNPVHKAEFRSFLNNGTWGDEGCPYMLEAPYDNVPQMIRDKIVRQAVGAKAIEPEDTMLKVA